MMKIFQALATEDVLLPKPFLDLRFDSVVRRKLLTPKMFFSFQNMWKSEEGKSGLMIPSTLRFRNSFGSRMSPSTTRAWKISSYITTSA
jgi:hypothetical protein